MTRLLNDPGWTESQREFVENLKATKATAVEFAVGVDKSMSLPPRELKSLIDSGIVREAAGGRYYLYLDQTRSVTDAVLSDFAPVSPPTPATWKRMLKMMIFWFLFILIPVLMLQLLGGG